MPYKQRVGGSSPSSSTIKVLLAQLVEHLTFNQRVRGSSPLQDTIFKEIGACLEINEMPGWRNW